MKKLMQGGIILIILGISIADSSSLIPSITFITLGTISTGATLICMQQKQ